MLHKKISGVSRLVLFGLIVLSLALMPACSTTSDTVAPEPETEGEAAPVEEDGTVEEPSAQTLTILAPVDWRPILDYVAEDWAAETGVTLDIVSLAYDEVQTSIVTSATGGADVDIIYVDTVWPAEFAQAGFLLPVEDYVTEELTSAIAPALLDQLTWDGHLWAFPYNNQSKWLFYNETILAEAGYDAPPATWEEMEAMSRDMMEQGLVEYGIAWGWAQAEGLICDATVILGGFDAVWQDADGAWAFDEAATVAGLEFMANSIAEDGWADPASISLNDRTNLNPFLAGDTAFVTNWAFAWGLIQDPNESQVVDQVAITVIPASEGASVPSSSVTGGGGWGVMANSDTPELAAEFIQYLIGYENQVTALSLQQNMPIYTDMYSDPDILAEYPHFEAMGPQFEYANFRPVLPWYSEWSLQAQIEIQSVLTDAKTAQDAYTDLYQFSVEKAEEYGS